MSDKGRIVHLQEGYQPRLSEAERVRFPMRPDGTIDPMKLKPPTGDTAIQPPIGTTTPQPPKPSTDGK